MEEEHHFTNVPYNYPLCLNRQCPKASTCLRQLVEQEVPDSAEYWVVISPKYQAKLKEYFSRRTYYRIRKGERLLSPAEQRDVQKILKQCGATGKQEFDAYVEDYEW